MEPERLGPPDPGNGAAAPPAMPPPSPPAVRDEWAVSDVRTLLGLPEEEIHLRDYWEVLVRHRWTILAFLAAVVLTTALVTFVMTPLYRATVLLEIRHENPKVMAFQDVVELAQSQREFFQTQYDVLRSRNLASRVIDALGLAADPAFNPPAADRGPLRRLLRAARQLVARGTAPADPALEGQQRLVETFLDHTAVNPRRNSYLVEVSFSSPSPTLAARVADAIAEHYVALALDQRLDAVHKGRAFIEGQLDVSRGALERAEEDLQAFSKAHEILTMDEKENIAYRKLADLNAALTGVQGDRMAKEALFRQTERGDFTEVSAVMNNPVVSAILQQVAKDEAEYSRLSKTFTSEYPKMKRLAAKLAELRSQLKGEAQRLGETLRADYEAALRNEKLLSDSLENQKRIVADLNQKAIDYKILKRQVDTNRGIYKALLQRLKEVEIAEGIKASNIYVLDAAQVPLRPARPRPLLNLALALLVGLAGGVGLAFLQEHLDSSIKTPDDVERYLRLPTLGALPMLRGRRGGQPRPDLVPELLTLDDPSSAGAEAMRTLRAALFLATAAGPPQRILVTSARPQEGKTCVSVNLAIILAQMGKRVVLIDTDLRRPRVHRVFEREIAPGLTNYLTGNADLPSIIQPVLPEAVPGLDLIVSGPVPPNPVELIDSRQMLSVLEELSRTYDFIVADGPPSLGFADVPLLSRHMGGLLLVVKSGETPRKVARQAADYLTRLRAKVLGVVLNHVNERERGYYYSYYGYYGAPEYGKREDDAALIEPARDHAA